MTITTLKTRETCSYHVAVCISCTKKNAKYFVLVVISSDIQEVIVGNFFHSS